MIATPEPVDQFRLRQIHDLVVEFAQELRNVSQGLQREVDESINIIKQIDIDIARINRSGVIKASLEIVGDQRELSGQTSLILYRVIQEALNNALKHSQADLIRITMNYGQKDLDVQIKDNGVGFDVKSALEKSHMTMGLQNIKSRSKLLDATFGLESEFGKGSVIDIRIPLTDNHTD